jgi:hypothetical protein
MILISIYMTGARNSGQTKRRRSWLKGEPRPEMTLLMTRQKHTRNVQAPDSGQALLELAIVLPVLIFIFFSIIDIGQMINQYLTLTEVAYEGARLGASLPGLPPVPGANDDSLKSCLEIKDRVYSILELTGYEEARDYCEVTIAYEPPAAAQAQAPGSTGQSVHVSVRVPFHPFLNLYSGLHISVTATAPYLFKDTNVATQGLQTLC